MYRTWNFCFYVSSLQNVLLYIKIERKNANSSLLQPKCVISMLTILYCVNDEVWLTAHVALSRAHQAKYSFHRVAMTCFCLAKGFFRWLQCWVICMIRKSTLRQTTLILTMEVFVLIVKKLGHIRVK